MNKIKIGFSLNRSEAGPAFFMNNLKQTLAQLPDVSTSYFFDPFVSVNLFANKPRLIKYRPFFFRVDGVAYDLKMSRDIKERINFDLIQGIQYARGIIYQSQFSKKLSEEILGIKPQNATVILNGTNLDYFSPYGSNIRKKLGIKNDAIVFVTSAKWRTHKRLKAVVNVFNKVNSLLSKKSYLIIIGEPDFLVDNGKSIITLGKIKHTELPEVLRAGDIFLFFSWLDNCPNSVIEAIACGMPVICTNQGGTCEIVNATSGGIIVQADEHFDFKELALCAPPIPNLNLIVEACMKVTNDLDVFKAKIRTDSIDIKNTAQLYLSFINSYLTGN